MSSSRLSSARLRWTLAAFSLLVLVVQGLAQAPGTFVPTGSSGVRLNSTATLLPNGKVLGVGGEDPSSFEAAFGGIYDPATGTWEPSQDLRSRVKYHTATLLKNGQVLVAGGGGLTSAAPLFDPATGTFSDTGTLNTSRIWHTATLLVDGRVLVAGGSTNAVSSSSSAEIYNPGTGKWTVTGSLKTPRFFHTATLLPDGRVLVAGGVFSGSFQQELASAELYDPASGTWSDAGPLTTARSSFTATLLTSGKVLLVGGAAAGVLATEFFNPATNSFVPADALHTARSNHTAVTLLDGRVLIMGGSSGQAKLASAELFDPYSETWGPAGNLLNARAQPAATLLLNGNVLVVGGSPTAKVSELYLGGSGSPQVGLPEVVTTSATAMTAAQASLTATVSSHGAASVATFAYSTDPALVAAVTETSVVGPLTANATNVPIIVAVFGLTADTQYYYRVSANNSAGVAQGEILSFRTTAVLPPTVEPPLAATTAALDPSDNKATLTAVLSSRGAATTAFFSYSRDPALLTDVICTPLVGPVEANVLNKVISTPITGLSGGRYYYRVSATNSAGSTLGNVASFLARSPLPPVEEPPLPATTTALAIASTGVTLTGNMTSRGSSAKAFFSYSEDPALLANVRDTPPVDFAAKGSNVAFSAVVSGLSANTRYYYRLAATNFVGSAQGATLSFTTANVASPNAAPMVATTSAIALRSHQATLTGVVSAQGAATTVTFSYSTDSALASNVTETVPVGPLTASSTNVSVGVPISGLSESTTYYYQTSATNSVGTSKGGILSFTTRGAPSPGVQAPLVTTTAATGITDLQATLHGLASSRGSATTTTFSYSKDPSLSANVTVTPPTGPLAADATDSAISVSIAGLQANTTYYYRASAGNAAGSAQGAILSFTTADNPPPGAQVPVSVTTSAISLTTNGATLTGKVSSRGSETTVRFLYSKDPALVADGINTPPTGPFPPNAADVILSAHILDLSANTKYYFRVVAVNTAGSAQGEIHSFTTENTLPIATDAESTLASRGTQAVQLPFPDVDSDGDTETLVDATGDENLTVASFSGHTVNVTPVADFTGAGSIKYKVSDGRATSTGIISITVRAGPKEFHEYSSDSSSLAPLTLAVLEVGAGQDHAGRTIVGVGNALFGTVKVAEDGLSLIYTPRVQFSTFAGVETFSYTFRESDGVIGTGTVQISNSALRSRGTYTGLLKSSGKSVGLLQITIAANKKFTGTLQVGASSYKFQGGLGTDLPTSITMRGEKAALQIAEAGDGSLTAHLVGGGTTGEATLRKSPFSATNPALQAGSYTVLLPAAPLLPGTAATATATVSSGGRLVSLQLTSGGAGYTVPPRVTVRSAHGKNAEVAGVVADGAVSELKVVAGGSRYSAEGLTVMIQAPADAVPAGTGYATMTVTRAGQISLAGRLGDGTSWSAGGLLNVRSEFPLYSPISYSPQGKGLLSGLLAFRDVPETSDADGLLSCSKAASEGSGTYRLGFSTDLTAIASRYLKPGSGEQALRFSDVKKGIASVTLEGGDLTASVNKQISVADANLISDTAPGTDRFKLKIDRDNGVLSGSMIGDISVGGSASRVPLTLSGVLFQKQNLAAGVFVGSRHSGMLQVTPQ